MNYYSKNEILLTVTENPNDINPTWFGDSKYRTSSGYFYIHPQGLHINKTTRYLYNEKILTENEFQATFNKVEWIMGTGAAVGVFEKRDRTLQTPTFKTEYKNSDINVKDSYLELGKSFNLLFKNSNGEISEIPHNKFHCTGYIPNLENAKETAREYGVGVLGTIGYFYDENNFLRNSSDIKNYI